MPGRPAMPNGRRMESTPPAFGAPQLFLSDARLYLGILNHVRYDALRWAFGVNREQANVVTFLLVAGAVESVYEGARRIPGLRPSISGVDAAIGAVALRDAALGAVGGPTGRQIRPSERSSRARRWPLSRFPACAGRSRVPARLSSGCARPRRGSAASASGATPPRASA
jgi:hypothetical protein